MAGAATRTKRQSGRFAAELRLGAGDRDSDDEQYALQRYGIGGEKRNHHARMISYAHQQRIWPTASAVGTAQTVS